jgi:AbiV family abortive infection protein
MAAKPMQKDEQTLSPEELAQAGLKALQNASELLEEAQLLFEHGHWGRAVFLCCISSEELGKCFISLSAVMNRRAGVFDERRYRTRFRTHREKTAILNFFEDIFVSSSDMPTEASQIDNDTKIMEKVKLASLYSDFYGSNAHAPSELINAKLATEVLKLTKNRVNHFLDNVRPKFAHALQIDPAQIARFQREFLKAMGPEVEPGSDS